MQSGVEERRRHLSDGVFHGNILQNHKDLELTVPPPPFVSA
jgi:hypothetical protein